MERTMEQMVIESAAPHTFAPSGNIDVLAAAFHRGVNVRLGKLVGADPAAAELFAYNARLLKQLPVTASCWQPETGATLAAICQDRPLDGVVHALFALHALRVAGAWRVELARPLRVGLAGHLFDLQGAVEIEADRDRVSVTRRGAGLAPISFDWTACGWRIAAGQAPEPLWGYCAPSYIDYAGFQDVYLQSWREPLASSVSEIVVDWPVPMLNGPDAALARDSAAQVDAAMGLLAQAGPGYLAWIAPLLRGIATCPLIAPGMRQSGTFSWHSGVFSCGFPISTEFLAEVFVHEMSHQHYLVLNSSVPLTVKGDGREIYYSSLKGKKRTIDKILLTYHATANMTLFWHDLAVASGGASESRVQETAFTLNHTHSMAEILIGSRELTAAGSLLYDTQARLLRERGYDFAPRAQSLLAA